MDTEAIATEIVRIRSRLNELDAEVEGSSETDVDDERAKLTERMRQLQDMLSGSGSSGSEGADQTDAIQYVRPA